MYSSYDDEDDGLKCKNLTVSMLKEFIRVEVDYRIVSMELL